MKADFEVEADRETMAAAFALTIDGESVAMSLDDAIYLARANPDSTLSRTIKAKLTEEELAGADFLAGLTEDQRKVVGSDPVEAWLPDSLLVRLIRDPETAAVAEQLKIALVAQKFAAQRDGAR